MPLKTIDGNVIDAAGNKLPYVHLSAAPAKKGTTAFKLWAQEQFERLLNNGYSYSAAIQYLGMETKTWELWSKREPEWAARMRAIRQGEAENWTYPDISSMSFDAFCQAYGGFALAEHQKWIEDALSDPLGRLVLVLGHPESGKSTLLSLWYVLYNIAKNPDIRIALVSKSSSKAQDLLTRVKRYLTEQHLYAETPRNLITDFNGWKPEHGEFEWSLDAIFVKHRKSGERDPTVQALGIGKQIYGTRLDLLILDDALVLDNQISELVRERIDSWFTNEAMSRVHRGQTIVNGTRLFPYDLYGQWKKSWMSNRLFRQVSIPAIQNEYTDDEVATWPQYWTLDGYDIYDTVDGEEVVTGYREGLRDIRERVVSRDLNRWKLVYQQEDVEETDSVFSERHIQQALDLGAHRRIGQVFDHEILILGVDPATSGRAASLLLAFDPQTRVRTVVDVFVGAHLGALGIRNDLFYRFWDKYRWHRVNYTALETNYAPTLLGDETFKARAEAAGTVLVEHKTVGKGHKRGSIHDEEYGIGAMASLFAGGLMALPSLTLEDRRVLTPLIDDMRVFPFADQKDALVALWVAETQTKNARLDVVDQVQSAVRRGVPPYLVQRATMMRGTDGDTYRTRSSIR